MENENGYSKKVQSALMVMFLLGIFIGGMDSGIVSPARTVIADALGVSADTSIWMITIYTLVYAVIMPISGKLADRYGKKKLFVFSITVFGIGSALCGISDYFGGYSFLIVARIIQAIGGGGIMPIATAFIGESFPKEKRGAALGIVGATYGIATTLGPTIGSGIINIFGRDNWGLLFFINVPICVVVVIMAARIKIKEKEFTDKKLDVLGSIIVSFMILSIMYAVTNLNFHDFGQSLKSTNVYPFLIVFIVLLPVFIYRENRAEDPIINLDYFRNRNIRITLIMALVVGCGMMSVVFIPQFGENVLRLSQGSGGYLITVMAICSGIAAPVGGKFIDKYSAKAVLLVGFASTVVGTLTLALFVSKTNNAIGLFIALALMGIGMGLTMGTPLNYLMQTYVKREEASSAQATLSLIKSVGIAVSPNILVNFIAEAGDKMPTKLMEVMPKIPGMASSASHSLGVSDVPTNILNSFQNADVTSITGVMKEFSNFMFDKAKPLIEQGMVGHLPPHTSMDTVFNGMKAQYLHQVDGAKTVIENTFQSTLNSGFASLFIASAIIALIGFICALCLKNKDSESSK
ncbi:permease [Clostridium baratii]|uniref:MFS transporter n=1 Tax=Clostridium baratii TaxID=1561 RepID=UPI0009A3EA85|nr:MFS transporter [Clostridium baratii]OPF52613.1 permease [Clostridium baratii]OPF56062.1 permease [Clostridium baratii]OPF58343.1 permease [Clostridium baratii]OPF59556.1 permease [Clostridium baratii]